MVIVIPVDYNLFNIYDMLLLLLIMIMIININNITFVFILFYFVVALTCCKCEVNFKMSAIRCTRLMLVTEAIPSRFLV